MPSKRSPNCPAHDLEESIAKVSAIYWAEGRNSFSGEKAVVHMGYNGLNGASRRALGAVRAFGLIEGRGRLLKVSDDAVLIIADEKAEDQREREAALQRALCHNRVFSDLFEHFDGASSTSQLSGFLQKKYRFKPLAAESTAEVYRRSHALLVPEANNESRIQSNNGKSAVNTAYSSVPDPVPDFKADSNQQQTGSIEVSDELPVPVLPASTIAQSMYCNTPLSERDEIQSATVAWQDSFSMENGTASLVWPREISPEEFEDFTDWLILEHRKVSRQIEGRNLPLLKRKKRKSNT